MTIKIAPFDNVPLGMTENGLSQILRFAPLDRTTMFCTRFFASLP